MNFVSAIRSFEIETESSSMWMVIYLVWEVQAASIKLLPAKWKHLSSTSVEGKCLNTADSEFGDWATMRKGIIPAVVFTAGAVEVFFETFSPSWVCSTGTCARPLAR